MKKINKSIIAITLAILLMPATFVIASGGKGYELPDVEIVVNKDTIAKGKQVFMDSCNVCHGLKFYNDDEHARGEIKPMLSDVGGVVPPDLTLMAKSRGRHYNKDGAKYIYHVITSYEEHNGKTINKAFANHTASEGVIAMPPPFGVEVSEEDKENAKLVAAFLHFAAEPSEDERKAIGKWVVMFCFLMAGILFLLYRAVWTGVSHELNKD